MFTEAAEEEPAGRAQDPGEPGPDKTSTAISPYSTGGGGVTFERKVAVQYLAHLLVGDRAVELGEGRFVVSVAFQQAPEHSVDDLVIRAARVDESEPSLVLAVGVRRSPDLVQSDESTRKLIRAFVRDPSTFGRIWRQPNRPAGLSPVLPDEVGHSGSQDFPTLPDASSSAHISREQRVAR